MEHKVYVKEVFIVCLTILVYAAPFPQAYVQSCSEQHLLETFLQGSRYPHVSIVTKCDPKIVEMAGGLDDIFLFIFIHFFTRTNNIAKTCAGKIHPILVRTAINHS